MNAETPATQFGLDGPDVPRQADARQRRCDAHEFRGWVINEFARLESAIGPILACAGGHKEYESLKPPFPHLAGQKFERLRKIAELGGPLKLDGKSILTLLDQLKSFENLRSQMAHGAVETARGDNGRDYYIFRLNRFAGGSSHESMLVVTDRKAKDQRSELRLVIDALIAQLDKVTAPASPTP